MAPLDYIQARQQELVHSPSASEELIQQEEDATRMEGTTTIKENKDAVFRKVMVDDKPYFPFLHVVPDADGYDAGRSSWVRSCRRAVAAIFELSDENVANSFAVTPVSGGNTNVLFCVSNIRISNYGNNNDKNYPDKVLVRIFGGHGLIDRDVETSTYAALAAQGLALPYYGRFGNGRIEGWSEWKCLDEAGMAKYALPIARSLATLHSTFHMPTPPDAFSSQPTTTASTSTSTSTPSPPPTDMPTMWVQLNDWIQTAVVATFQTPHDTERASALQLDTWQDELTFLKEKVVPNDAAVGFCHNDVLSSNIMVDPSSSSSSSSSPSSPDAVVQLIDFEYGGVNYFSYDIANHFNEYAGGTDPSATPKYDQFPSRELQKAFVKEYMTTWNLRIVQQQQQIELTSSLAPTIPPEAEVLERLHEIDGFVLANHMVWALWAVNQASTEGCVDFDYLKYAQYRMQRYYEDKKEIIQHAEES